MALRTPVAFAVVVGATGVGTTTKNCATARTGAGVYTVTLGAPGIAATECHVSVSPRTANIIAQVVNTSDTVKTINTFLGSTGAATDSDFSVQIDQDSAGTQ